MGCATNTWSMGSSMMGSTMKSCAWAAQWYISRGSSMIMMHISLRKIMDLESSMGQYAVVQLEDKMQPDVRYQLKQNVFNWSRRYRRWSMLRSRQVKVLTSVVIVLSLSLFLCWTLKIKEDLIKGFPHTLWGLSLACAISCVLLSWLVFCILYLCSICSLS